MSQKLKRDGAMSHALRRNSLLIAAFSWTWQKSESAYGHTAAVMDAAAEIERQAMRTQANKESSERPDTDDPARRNLQAAADLLQQALVLLQADSIPPLAHTTTRTSDRLLRLPEVQRLTGLRRSAIYEQMQRGAFPRSVKAGQRITTWPESAIQSWISGRLERQAT